MSEYDITEYTNESRREKLKHYWAEQDRLIIGEEYRKLLGSAGGRKLLFYLLGLAGIGHNPFRKNALEMSFACGELNVGNQILADILQVNPHGWIEMQKEATDEQRNRDAELAG